MKLLRLALLAGSVLADDAPDWAREAASRPSPQYPAKLSAVVLLQEEHLTVDSEGRRLMRERGVIRILQQGREKVTAFRPYNTRSGKIRDFQGWLISPQGKATSFGKNAVVDVALSTEYTYDEARAKVLDPGSGHSAGAVFAYEVVEEEKTVFTQYQYRFQERIPVLLSRFIVTLPPGWEVGSTVSNSLRLQPQVSGTTYTWEMRDLPWIEEEEYGQETHSVAPRIGISYYPSADARPSLRPLKDWAAVSAWLSGFVDPSAELSSSIRDAAAEITKTSKTEIEKIRAIASFAQQTNYVSVQMNTTRGGGYTPNRAEQVLTRKYGDCKDKATLMRALLSALGIESYFTVIYSGDREFVRPDWPSSLQFNHAIIAVRVSPDSQAATIIQHPRLGRLLIFDPTDDSTPLGGLPEHEQGSHALILAGGQGELVKMPLLPPSTNRVESTVDAEMNSEGALTARTVRHYFGQPASRLRTLTRRQEGDPLKRAFETGLSRRLGGMSLKSIKPSDRMEEGRLQLNIEFDVGQFGQLMQGRLLVLNPGALVPGAGYSFSSKDRKSPVRLSAALSKDSVGIALPLHFKVDEIPDPVKLESPYGSYTAAWSIKENKLLFEQQIEIKDMLAPAADFAKVRAFFDALSGSQHAPVVLLKQ